MLFSVCIFMCVCLQIYRCTCIYTHMFKCMLYFALGCKGVLFLLFSFFFFSHTHTAPADSWSRLRSGCCLGREDEVQVRLSAQLVPWDQSSSVQVPLLWAGLNMGSLQILGRQLQPNNSNQCLVFHFSDKMLSCSASHGATFIWNLGLNLDEATGQMILLKDLEAEKEKGREEKDGPTCHLGMMSFKGLNVFISSCSWRRQEPNPTLLLFSVKNIFYPSGRMCYFLSISVNS